MVSSFLPKLDSRNAIPAFLVAATVGSLICPGMLGRPKTACEKCSAQKLRCSGHKPSCQRCLRLRRPCVYENSFRSSPTGRKVLELSTMPPAILEKTYVGIPTALIEPLVDVFFSHVYNASLLYHLPSLKAALVDESLRPDILLSICAFAAKFYRDSSNNLALLSSGFCVEWAERASQIVFQEVQVPTDENISTFINLALFWYSMGQFRRSSMHECCGTNSAIILGLLTEKKGNEHSLRAEIRRRRFWACYAINSFTSKSILSLSPTEEMRSLSLPCREADYLLSRPCDLISMKSSTSNGSVFAELLKATTLWSEVRFFVKRTDSDWTSRLATMQTLDSRIRDWWSRLPSNLSIDVLNLRTDVQPNTLLVNTLYHVSLCALHSSVVPLYTWNTGGVPPPYTLTLSAQNAFHHANAISSVLRAARGVQFDPARFSSFVGYAAYCACAIQMPFLWCGKVGVRQRTVENLLTNMDIIQAIGIHWKFISILGNNVRWIYKLHARAPVHLADEPIHLDSTLLSCSQPGVPRTRLSVVTHNEILIGPGGAVAADGKDIEDLGSENQRDGYQTDPADSGIDFADEPLFVDMYPLTAPGFPAFHDASLFVDGVGYSDQDALDQSNENDDLQNWINNLSKIGPAVECSGDVSHGN